MSHLSAVTHPLMRLCQGLALAMITGSAWSVDTTAEQVSVQWKEWSTEVLHQAHRERRLILLDLTAEWCQFCRKMDEVTYRNQDVVELINRQFVPVRVDDKGRSELAVRYQGVVRPATIILDAKGNELIRKPGYLQPQWMVWLLQAVAMNPSVEAHADY